MEKDLLNDANYVKFILGHYDQKLIKIKNFTVCPGRYSPEIMKDIVGIEQLICQIKKIVESI